MDAIIRVNNNGVSCQASSATPLELYINGDEFLPSLVDWAQRYNVAIAADKLGEFDASARLVAIGQEMFTVINTNGWAKNWISGSGPRQLTIQVDATSDLANAVLDAPWELLAGSEGLLVDNAVQPFLLARRIGAAMEPATPAFTDFKLIFMAAAPDGKQELQYEAEEAAILNATKRLPMHLVVEETGALGPLGQRLALEPEAFDALHISCHGGIDNGQPCLLLEAAEGGKAQFTYAHQLVAAIGTDHHAPQLIFLSACQTAQTETKSGRISESFARQVIRAGIPNVLGWDGSVYDMDASHFAEYFYAEIAKHRSVVQAAMYARFALRDLQRKNPEQGRHWHLARLYLGHRGGGSLVGEHGMRRRLVGTATRNEFLDRSRLMVPVAARTAFVGRRRELQRILHAFALEDAPGVLIHGMGNLGKSSLAARVRDRMVHHRTIVIFDRYDALHVFDRLCEILPAHERQTFRHVWREQIANHPALLGDALEVLLADSNLEPMLLVIDDLERVLERPTQQTVAAVPVNPEFREMLRGVLRAFDRINTRCKLLLTSRYIFSMIDESGEDIAGRLMHVHLKPMHDIEREKQLLAAALETQLSEEQAQLAARILAAAKGNPGLQDVLTRPLLRGEIAVAERALCVWEHYRKTGVEPASLAELINQGMAKDQGNALMAFFQRMAFDVFREALAPDQVLTLAAMCWFCEGLPIPYAAVEAAATAAGAVHAANSLERLLALGLLDDWGVVEDAQAISANPLARPLAKVLPSDVNVSIADAAVTALDRIWRDDSGGVVSGLRAEELVRLILLSSVAPLDLLDLAAASAARFVFGVHNDARRARTQVLLPALQRLQSDGRTPSWTLALIAYDVAERLVDMRLVEFATKSLADMVEQLPPDKAAAVLCRLAARCQRTGDFDQALDHFDRAAKLFEKVNARREVAIARGGIADILQTRSLLDEALRIRREEELPVYEQLGDLRAKATAMGKIADILEARGQLDEALRICREETLPVYERLGDVRSKALTMGQIADILETRGHLDEVLRIRREDELPVYEQLGDVRSKAVTMGKIADILEARGQFDEALRIRYEEELPVCEQLGDVRGKAITMGKIADILEVRGQLDEALCIRRDEELPVYDQLGDLYSKTVTMGQIADALEIQGQLDEALRIRQEDVLPVCEQLGDVRSKAITMGKIADILETRGQLDEALRIRQEDALPVYEALGDVYSKAITMSKIAGILTARGQHDEALHILRDEVLPVCEQLGDVRGRAITLGKIADILVAYGQFDKALRIRQEEELPVYERLGDVHSQVATMGDIADIFSARGQFNEALAIAHARIPLLGSASHAIGLAHVHLKIADIRLQRGDHQLGGMQEVCEHLTQAFSYARQTQRPDAISMTGFRLAQVLAMNGAREEALEVLPQSLDAANVIGHQTLISKLLQLKSALLIDDSR